MIYKEEDWRKQAELKLKKMPSEAKEIRELAQTNLLFFARLVNPGYVYGQVHEECFKWMEDYSLHSGGGGSSNKLIMLPRAHLKSHMVATWAAWIITRHPEITILYVSATAEAFCYSEHSSKQRISTVFSRIHQSPRR
jgi:hypothetical protein